MKPMKSDVLNGILDTLTKIGQKHVKKSETLLNSLNIKDDMIKVASKQIVLDSIEKKLRTGYVHPLSMRTATQITGLPPTQEELVSKNKGAKPRFPGSAMGKYPSGSESNTEYGQGGGDQTPGQSTMAGTRGRTIKAVSDEAQAFISKKISILRDEGKSEDQAAAIAYSMARKEGFDVPEKKASITQRALELDQRVVVKAGTYRDQDNYDVDILKPTQGVVTDHLEENVYSVQCDDGHYIQVTGSDVESPGASFEQRWQKKSGDRGGLRATASGKLSEVIRELKNEDSIFVDVRDIAMRLNQKGQQTMPAIESLCKTLADEGITLVKFAGDDADNEQGQDITKVQSQPGMGYNDATDQVVPKGSAEDDTANPVQADEEIIKRDIELEQAAVDEYEGQKNQASPELQDTLDHLIEEEKEHREELEQHTAKAKDLGRGQGGPGRGGRPKTDEERAKTHGGDKDDLPPRGTGLGRKFDGIGRGQGGPGRGMGRRFRGPISNPTASAEGKVRCNNCEWVGCEEDLVKVDDQGEIINACPNCKTDHYLMDNFIPYTAGAEGMEVTAASIDAIKSNIEHARDQRAYNIERLQEKGLEDGDKDRYQKAKTKWEKEIDRLDRELSRAMKADRKKERDEAKQEKEKEQAEQPAVEPITAGAVSEITVFADDQPSLDSSQLTGDLPEPMSDPSFSVQKFLEPTEFMEYQRLKDLNKQQWEDILVRRNENIERGKEPSIGIDFTESQVTETKLKHYMDLAKSRKSGVELPDAPEPETPPMPPMGEGMPAAGPEKPEGGPEEGVLTKKPEALPEFASSRTRMVRKAAVVSVYGKKYVATPVWDATSHEGKLAKYEIKEADTNKKLNDLPTTKELSVYQLQNEIAKRIRGVRSTNMQRKAVTCQDFPEVCKNCKSLCVPAGYNELTFLDHKDKPFCAASDSSKNIGFRWSFARDCRGYDPIVKEYQQRPDTETETIFNSLKDRGEKPVMKKAAYDNVPKTKVEMSETDKSLEKTEMDKAKSQCPKCFAAGYYQKVGEVHPAHSWHKMWNCDWNSVCHCKDGVCVPKSMAMQSKPDSGVNQFDTSRNRIVNTEKK